MINRWHGNQTYTVDMIKQTSKDIPILTSLVEAAAYMEISKQWLQHKCQALEEIFLVTCLITGKQCYFTKRPNGRPVFEVMELTDTILICESMSVVCKRLEISKSAVYHQLRGRKGFYKLISLKNNKTGIIKINGYKDHHPESKSRIGRYPT